MSGSLTASLTLRLRDQLSVGVEDILKEFKALNETLAGVRDALGGIREALASLKAPAALTAGMDGVAASARAAAADVKAIGVEAAASARALDTTSGAARRPAFGGLPHGAVGGGIDGLLAFFAAMVGLGAVKSYSGFVQPLGHAAITEKLSGPAAMKEANRLAARLQPLALATATSSQDLAQAEFFLITTGLSRKLVGQMMAPLAAASTAYNTPVTDMAQAVFTLAENYKIAPGALGGALATLAYAGKLGHFSMADFSRYLPEIGGLMGSLGMTGLAGEQVGAAALEIIRRNSADSPAAATNLEDLLNYITSPIAVRMFDLTKRMRSLAGAPAMRLIDKYHIKPLDLPAFLNAEHNKGIDPVNAMADYFKRILAPVKSATDRATILHMFLHNQEAEQAMLALVQYAAAFKRDQAVLGHVGPGTLKTDLATALGFPEARVKIFEETFAQLERALGKDLLPVLTAVNGVLKGFLGGLRALDQDMPGLGAVLVQAAALGLAFKTLVGVVSAGAGVIARVLGVAVPAAGGEVAAAAAGASGAGALAGYYWPAVGAVGGSIYLHELQKVLAAAAVQAAEIWSRNAHATLKVIIAPEQAGLPSPTDANAVPVLLHVTARNETAPFGPHAPLGIVLGRH